MLSSILEQVRTSSSGRLDPHKVAKLLHVSLEDVAALARTHPSTLSRIPDSHRVEVGLSAIVRILVKVSQVMGEDGIVDRAVLWFKNQPLSGFEGKTAMELVREGKADAVLEHLAMLEDGVYA